MQRGDRVKVYGLVTATQHNGKYGVVTNAKLSTDGRVAVNLDDGAVINVKPGNLELILMDLGGKELKVGTKVVTVAFVEPYPKDLSLIGYVKDFSPDRTMVKCTFTENPPNERQYFVTNIQNLRVAPRQDEEIPLRFAIDIHRPDIMTQKKVVIEDSGVNDLSGIESLTSAVSINLSNNEIASLEQIVRLPPVCLELNLADCQIASLENVVFVSPMLRTLKLQGNKIKRLDGVKFPDSLTKLDLSDNKITSLFSTVFPDNLKELLLDGNPIVSIERLVLPTKLGKITLSNTCKVSVDFLSKYKLAAIGNGPNGRYVSYEVKTWFPSMQKLMSQERGEELSQNWEYTGDPKSVVSALTDSDALGEERDAFLADLESLGEDDESKFKHLLALKPRSDTTKALDTFPPPPPRPPPASQAEADARLKPFLEGVEGYHNKMMTQYKTNTLNGGEYGGSKSKTRRRQRQNKRNKLQRKTKYKYSRRRRNAKSRSK
jgi:hypothetical protein